MGYSLVFGIGSQRFTSRSSRGRSLCAGILAALMGTSTAFAQPTPPAPTPPPAGSAPVPPAASVPSDGAPGAPPAPTEPPAASEDSGPSEATKQEARAHFEKGLALFNEGAWAAALAEFLLSRELYPRRAATNNAAIALRKLQRFDEALAMFEVLLRDFPNLPPNEKVVAQRAMAELSGLVGTIEISGAEPGAAIVISGQTRGEYPPATPIRVAAGTHLVRVFKEGFEPSETRIDVAGGQTARVSAKLRVLAQSGRLKVTERTGKAVDVVVDNAVVGQAPWEGILGVGNHTVVLRGKGKIGTQPAVAPVKSQELTLLTLIAEDLDASVRVDPTPAGATVAVDSVSVGRGVWLGRLKTGPHKIEVIADGFVSETRNVQLDRGEREVVTVALERDPDAIVWRKPSKLTFDAGVSVAIAPSFGGEVAGGCGGDCTSSIGVGGIGLIHGGYQFGSGFGLGLAAGYLIAAQETETRATQINPNGGLPPDLGTANDSLRLTGFLVGATAGYHLGDQYPLHIRLGAGALFGQLRDERSGTFTTRSGSSFDAYPVADQRTATYFYLDPEVRIGARFADHFEVSAGIQALLLIAIEQPKWDDTLELAASSDGIGTYSADALLGNFVVMIAPGVNLRYEF